MLHCRGLANAMHSWAGTGRTIPQAPSPPNSSASAPATAKGVNAAVAAVATAYNDKCKPAHEVAVQGSQALDGVRSALTTYMRQDGGRALRGLPDLASLGCAELKAAGNSYRFAITPSHPSSVSPCISLPHPHTPPDYHYTCHTANVHTALQ